MSYPLAKIKDEALETVRLGIPVVITQLLAISMQFTDTVMAGNLSAKALAAVAVGAGLMGPLWVFCLGVIFVINPIVAQHHGAGRFDEIASHFWQSFWLSQMLAWPFVFAMNHAVPVMRLFHIDPSLWDITAGYLQAFSWGIPAACGFFSLRYFNEGLAVSKPAMYFSLIGLGMNVLGNWAFMFGHFGFPAMGAVGTGWASALVWWVMFICIALFTFRKRNRRKLHLLRHFRLPSWHYLKEILHIGLPNGISFSLEVTMFAVAALIIGSLGVNPMAAHQVTINFAATTFMIPLGLSIATTSRVGFAIGEQNPQRARLIGQVGIGLSAVVMSCTALFMITFPEAIISIYTHDAAVKAIAVKLLLLAGIFQISDGLQVSASGALRGYKDTKIPMMVNLLSYWIVGIPVGYILGICKGFGAQGLWVGLIAGLTVAAALHNWRFGVLSRAVDSAVDEPAPPAAEPSSGTA